MSAVNPLTALYELLTYSLSFIILLHTLRVAHFPYTWALWLKLVCAIYIRHFEKLIRFVLYRYTSLSHQILENIIILNYFVLVVVFVLKKIQVPIKGSVCYIVAITYFIKYYNNVHKSAQVPSY